MVLVAAILAGCATAPPLRPVDPDSTNLTRSNGVGDCARYLARLDEQVNAAGVGDAQYARIPGFPYLRTSRFLSSSAKPDPDTAAFVAWVEQLRFLDREARALEYANLPTQVNRDVDKTRVNECAQRLERHDLSDTPTKAKLHEAATTPDSYRPSQRLLGLYPLTSIPFEMGVKKLHRELGENFSRPVSTLPVVGNLQRYRHQGDAPRLSPDEVSTIIGRSSANLLGMPRPQGNDLDRLFTTFAPVWEVDVVNDDDHLGTPYWPSGAEAPAVKPRRPVAYTLLSHTRLGDEVLLQLNYIVWFAARPRSGPFDLLGGPVDGITWRVTLGGDGEVVLYDAIHNCGCYHTVFPTRHVRVLRRQSGHEEPMLIAPVTTEGDGPAVIRVQSATHYIQQVYFDGSSSSRDLAYPLRPYDELRSLALPGGGRRSFFAPDGLVPGTERGERWLFWPMGVAEPGAMRQWGTHAIAFVGRRHFDDPELFEPYLQLLR